MVIKELLQVLEYMHGKQVTHRDIKLENIIYDPKTQKLKLIDFGFCCLGNQSLQTLYCGTPSYMAPEIVSKTPYCGPPTDVWATGVLMFCLSTGRLPFKAS